MGRARGGGGATLARTHLPLRFNASVDALRRTHETTHAPVCIISTAHQARPNVMGQIEPFRAQFAKSSRDDTTNSALLSIALFFEIIESSWFGVAFEVWNSFTCTAAAHGTRRRSGAAEKRRRTAAPPRRPSIVPT